MKCNICGGEMPDRQSVCKYCGNVMPPREDIKPPQEKNTTDDTHEKRYVHSDTRGVDARIYQQDRSKGGFCVKCGRPLDGVTHKCIVCDAAQVSRRAYTNEDYKNMEMNKMAQKKKKKKKNNSVRNVILAILAMIVIFSLAAYVALELSGKLGIGVKNNDNDPLTGTNPPRVTADPNWKADVSDETPKKTPTPEPTVTPSMVPARTPEPVETGDPVDVRGGKYLYESDTHLISTEELDKLTREQIKRIYWEIYARHGYTFDDDLADYFENNHEWYMPVTSDKSKIEAKFNDIEKRNKSKIEDYQREKGWRQ